MKIYLLKNNLFLDNLDSSPRNREINTQKEIDNINMFKRYSIKKMI